MTTLRPYDPTDWGDIKIPKFRDPERCFKFLKKHGFNRLPAHVEPVFLKDLGLAIDYARKADTRLPIEFENALMEDPKLAYRYIVQVIGAPFPEFESAFSKNPSILVEYAKDILRGPFPEHLENCLAGDAFSCFEYSWQILDGRLPETLHNFMFCANMDSGLGRKYRGYKSKLHQAEEYNPDYSSPQEYFEFIKWQRKNLHRQIKHYQKIYGVDDSKSVGEFLYELEHGR